MEFIQTIKEVKNMIKEIKASGKSVGLVPTMGYLHEGHISLVRRSVEENDITIMSIFVNPVQFGKNEDLSRYPRDIDRDRRMAEEAGVDMIFAPGSGEMYPDGYSTYVNVEEITEDLCGSSRPGHFRGVATVVSKLFNIIEPDRAYFGQKDAQQAAVIKRMVRDLNMTPKIIICPIIREKDGLAMSSRNVYLNSEQRKSALLLSTSLFDALNMVKLGEKNSQKIIGCVKGIIESDGANDLEYIQIVDYDTFKPVQTVSHSALLAVAVKIGTTRLIDNILLEV